MSSEMASPLSGLDLVAWFHQILSEKNRHRIYESMVSTQPTDFMEGSNRRWVRNCMIFVIAAGLIIAYTQPVALGVSVTTFNPRKGRKI